MRPLLAALLLSLASCAPSPSASDRPAGATATGPAAASAPAPASGPAASGPAASAPTASTLPDGLTEEEFKALHDMPREAAAAPKGVMVDLAGTRAYLSLPEGGAAPLPGITVIHEWWGLNDNVKHWADRLAEDGYAALAVDLYGGVVATTPDEAMAAMNAVDDAKMLETLLAAHAFLAADPRVAATKRGSIGWCFGGGASLELALNAPDLDAAVIYYGRVVTDPTQLKSIRASVLGIFGNRDASIPPATVDELEKGLEAAGVEHRILRYDADHAFANPSAKGRYDQANAAAAWAETRAFLARELK